MRERRADVATALTPRASRAMRLILLALLPALASASYDVFGASITGPLDETSCNIEVVEEANSDHLHGLLDELTATTFFRLINVNMDGRCPYWGASPEEDDEPACESKAEDTAVPLCTLGTDGGGDNPFALSNRWSKQTVESGKTEEACDYSATMRGIR